MKNIKKEKKVVTSDTLVMLLIIGGILLVLIGFVTYNFGHSQGMADKAKQAEDAINKELTQMAENQQAMIEKYEGVYDIVTDGTTHESEDQYDLSVFKKDYPLINYSGLSNWQIILRNADGTSYVCGDSEILNKYSDKLYTYITPYNDQEEPANTLSVLLNGEIADIMLCERVYFTSQELRDAFVQAPSSN